MTKFKLLTSFFICIFISSSVMALQSKPDEQQYKIKFDYINHLKERELVYQYFLNKDQKHNINDNYLQKEHIGIDLYDIDGDGNKEILAYISNSAYCGSHGCSFSIFKLNDPDKLFPLYWNKDLTNDSLNVYEKISILKNKNMNFHDVLFGVYNRIWRWQENHYGMIDK